MPKTQDKPDHYFKNTLRKLKSQSNTKLVESARSAGRDHRRQMLMIIAHLAEIFRRKHYGELGYQSLDHFAISELKMGSTSTAHRYCHIARLTAKFPEVLDMIEAGELTLETAAEVQRQFREEERRQPNAAEQLKKKTQEQTEIPLSENEPKAAPLDNDQKREILHSIKNLNREQAQRKIAESLNHDPAPERPPSFVRAQPGNWNYLNIALSDDELALFDKLRHLLSHKTSTGNIADTQLRIMMEMLEKHDPVQIQKRSEQRKARQAKQGSEPNQASESKEASQSNETNPLNKTVQSVKATQPDRTSQPVQSRRTNETCEPAKTYVAAESCTQETGAQTAEKNKSDLQDPCEKKPFKSVSQLKLELRVNSQTLKAESEHRCQYRSPSTGRQCQQNSKLDVDHIVPKSKGGGNDLENLQLMCPLHNRSIKRDHIA